MIELIDAINLLFGSSHWRGLINESYELCGHRLDKPVAIRIMRNYAAGRDPLHETDNFNYCNQCGTPLTEYDRERISTFAEGYSNSYLFRYIHGPISKRIISLRERDSD